MNWYSTKGNRQRTPHKRGFRWRNIIVAVEMDGNRIVAPGTWWLDGNHTPRYKAQGINVEPYAWAYAPDAPHPSKVRP